MHVMRVLMIACKLLISVYVYIRIHVHHDAYKACHDHKSTYWQSFICLFSQSDIHDGIDLENPCKFQRYVNWTAYQAVSLA